MRPLHPRPLSGTAGRITAVLVSLPVVLGFVVPVAHLANEAAARVRFAGLSPVLFGEMVNTVILALIATPITVLFGLVVAYAVRRSRRAAAVAVVRVAGLGYAVPGTVLAIGLVTALATADAWIGAVARWATGVPTGLFLTASGAALIYAYVVRFLAIAANGVEAGLANIPTALDDAASVLKADRLRTMVRIHVPILWPALAAAGLLVFVDVMKELPATLLLRPVGFETLATHVFAEASRGTYEDGAVAALLIVLAGLGPVVLLSRLGRPRHAGRPPGPEADVLRV
jgi:iron(III) transport system permease protein